MKHLVSSIVFGLLIAIIHSPAIAQNTFAPIGAEWWYQGNNYNYASWPGGLGEPNKTWTDHVQVVGDTLIHGTNSRKLTVKRRYKSGGFGDSILEVNTRFIYLYDNTDTVFVYDPTRGDFSPLYIFNVAVKDTIRLRNPLLSGQADSLYVVIDSIVSENFGGQFFKSYYTRSYKSDTATGGFSLALNYGSLRGLSDLESTGKYTERLGMTLPKLAGFFPYVTSNAVDVILDADFPSGTLVCYNDPSYTIKLDTTNCDFIPTPTLGITPLKWKANVTLSPNPARDMIHLNSKELLSAGTSIQLYDWSGKAIRPAVDASGKNSVQINVSHLPQGMYIFQIVGPHMYSFHKMVVQNK